MDLLGGYTWIGIWIDITEAPAGATVTGIDLHFEISPDSGFVYVRLSDEEGEPGDALPLLEGVAGYGDPISKTYTMLSGLNGRLVNQKWILWVAEYYASEIGHVDSWWIKVYYSDGSTSYCGTTTNYANYEYISRVKTGDIDKSSGANGYSDYTALSTEMQIGQSYAITITNGAPYEGQDRCGIWIDWNQDKDFDDPNEAIHITNSPGNGPYTATITPPADAHLGETRMRTRIVWNEIPNPCDASDYGEVEDYTIKVAAEVQSLKVFGHVTLSDGRPLSGVLLEAYYGISTPSGLTDISDSNGYYEITLESPWTGHIHASKDHYDFSWPAFFTNVTTNQTQNFIANYAYSGGLGTFGSPYEIATPEDMNAIGAHKEDWSKYFILTADIDLSAYSGIQFKIIGNLDTPFTGVFNGNGHTISNFNYRATNESYIGLFGYINGSSAEIKNLGLIDPNIAGETFLANQCVGSLAAQINQGIIANCYVENCYVSNLYQVAGGLVGSLIDGEITNCHANGSVYGKSDAGGLVGHCSSGIITDCHSDTNTTGENEIGGLVGINLGTISKCSSSGVISGSENIGGLVGKNLEGIISQSYSTASVSGDIYIGGLVGLNNTYIGRKAHISNCYSTGSVVGYNYAAGLVGNNLCSAISYCYSNGYVESTVNAGGLVASNGGSMSSTCTSSFWDMEASGRSWSRQGIGKTKTQMMQKSTFAGWDFSTPIWKICDGTNYPKLAWQVPLPGDFVCPDGVEFNDAAVLAKQWLLERLSADIKPDGGDGIVDLTDWAIFANAWQSTNATTGNWNPKCDIAPKGGDGVIDGDDFKVFVNQWMQPGSYCADIAPAPEGDGKVNMLDFAVIAENWLIQR